MLRRGAVHRQRREGTADMPRNSPSQAEPIDQSQTEAAYSRWAPVYDLIFNLPFHPGRTAAARAANAAAPNGDVLVVGVGTGLELGLLSKTRASPASISARRC